MIGGAAERQRHVRRGEQRQQAIEQRGVFDGEHERQPAAGAVVDDETGLDAGDIRWRRGENGVRLAQLARMRTILGIIDGDVFATRQRQRKRQRLGLGARTTRRHHDDLEGGTIAHGAGDGGDGRGIDRFDEQLDVEAVARPIRYYGANARNGGNPWNLTPEGP